ncbi:MAG: hypothetical protein GWN72_00465, partial [Nitrospinaceae bacterium]|nr:hypothetical protein [Nitrospinaceae bacterium]NIU94885.1 hypothetical protein [Nitrospinaceae bacterium]NIW57588.1 hypothetical protein [Nitrospinaceae bacterium]
MNYSQDKRKWVVVYLAVFSALMVTSLYPPVPAYADACKNAVYQLRGTLNQSQGKGGIWKYMEQNSSLKEKSVIGLQVDGKLNRAVVIFENQCAKTKRPSGENFNKINDLLGEA